MGERAPVIRRYVARVPGSRPHVPIDRHEPVEAFETIASSYPVLRWYRHHLKVTDPFILDSNAAQKTFDLAPTPWDDMLAGAIDSYRD